MAKNREELLRVSEQYASRIGAIISNAVNGIMRRGSLTADNISGLLNINPAEIQELLHGNVGVLSLSSLSKLLVLTGQSLDIKQVAAQNRPQSHKAVGFDGGVMLGEQPQIQRPQAGIGPFMGNPNPPRTNEHSGPARDARGRFVRRSARPQQQQEPQPMMADMPGAAPRVVNRLTRMSNEELINIIEANMWDGEIDLDNASREQMIGFIMAKERIMADSARAQRQRHADANEANEQQAPAFAGTTAGDVKDTNEHTASERVLESLINTISGVIEEAKKNPEIMSVISRLVPRR